MNIQLPRNRPRKMGDYNCKYCHKNYRKEENYKKHVNCCEYFYRARSYHDDSYEVLPTAREQFKLIQHMAYEIECLKKEVAKLKTNGTIRQRKQIMEYLSDKSPANTMVEWARNFAIEQKHLETVFDYDLTEGMKAFIKQNCNQSTASILTSTSSKPIFPICSFSQKQNTLYVYDTIQTDDKSVVTPTLEKKWRIMSNSDIAKFVAILQNRFLKAYMTWQKTKLDEINNDNETKEKHIIYSMKINGGLKNEERRCNEIKRTLYDVMKVNVQNVE